MKKNHFICILFSGLLSLMIIILGTIGSVGIITIIKRLLLYVPLFSLCLLLMVFLLQFWQESSLKDTSTKKNQKNKSKHQASELGNKLNIKDNPSSKDNEYKDTLNIEPEKAAAVVRKMLKSDD